MNTTENDPIGALKLLQDAIRERQHRYDIENGTKPPLPLYNDNINKVVTHRLYPNVRPKTKYTNDENTYAAIYFVYSPKSPIPTAPQLPIRMH